jgi:hydrogenase-4 membrane subunit HyfE
LSTGNAQMHTINSKAMQVTKFFADANFYLSVIVLVYGGLTAVTENYCIFEFNEDLFGAMHNNLRIALLYLAMTEVVVCLFCFITKQPKMMTFVGYFLLMMVGSLAFYGKINSVPIDSDIPLFFLYTGISHIVFGFLSGQENVNTKKYS